MLQKRLKKIFQKISGGEDNPVGLSMKLCSESREEGAPRNLLSPMTTTQVGTWKVRTMYETEKTVQIAAEMSRYKHAVLGLCEMDALRADSPAHRRNPYLIRTRGRARSAHRRS